MSFVNKIKGWGQKGGAEPSALDGDVAVADDYRPRRGSASHAATDLPLADVEAAGAFDAMPQHGDGAAPPSSIISEVVPSENADFTETRLQGADTGAAPLGAALPLIGERPAAEQQRILLAMLGVGLVGLIVLTILSFSSAGRGSAQVAASGQALMQSQRLAKSVSQALTGNPTAFPEVKNSAEVLAENVRSLKTGDGPVAAAPSGVQDTLDAAMPLVDRAEKSAGIVVAQQKALTEVGQ
jgi:twitching motility protein PilJ